MQLERKDQIIILACKAFGYFSWFLIYFIILYRIFTGRMHYITAGCMVMMWTYNGYQMGRIHERQKREKEREKILEDLVNGRKDEIHRG